MVRDVLLAQIPVVLRVDIYAAAALRRPSYRRATHHRRHLGGALCFTLRMLAVGAELAAAEGWRLLTDRIRRYLTIAGSRTSALRNAGITSSAKRCNCSSASDFGTPTDSDTEMRSSAGYFSSSALR
jgi:hypothetical protein